MLGPQNDKENVHDRYVCGLYYAYSLHSMKLSVTLYHGDENCTTEFHASRLIAT
jgi:hypothetical protein